MTHIDDDEPAAYIDHRDLDARQLRIFFHQSREAQPLRLTPRGPMVCTITARGKSKLGPRTRGM